MSPVLIIVGVSVFLLLILATWKAPRLTSIILWALVAAIFTSSAILVAAPGPFADKALWITLAVPIIWTVFQFWTYWDGNKWRVAFGLVAISVACAAIVFTTDPMV